MFQEQFVDTLNSAASAFTPVMQDQAAQMVQELSVWDLTMRGGLIMIPLAILSVISIYIFVERYIAISPLFPVSEWMLSLTKEEYAVLFPYRYIYNR